jgi:hypothetical protein
MQAQEMKKIGRNEHEHFTKKHEHREENLTTTMITNKTLTLFVWLLHGHSKLCVFHHNWCFDTVLHSKVYDFCKSNYINSKQSLSNFTQLLLQLFIIFFNTL